MSGASSKKGGLSFGGDRNKRILQVAVGGLIIVVLFAIAFHFIGSSGKTNIDQLYQVAADQQNMIAITKIGVANCTDQLLINQSVSAQQIITTQAINLTAYMSSAGIKNDAKLINSDINSQAQKDLNTAVGTGQFDDSFLSAYADQLNVYKAALQTAYSSAKKQALKNQLANDYAALNNLNSISSVND